MKYIQIVSAIIASGLAGAIVAAIVNHVQGDDVEKCTKGGLAGGLATAVLTLAINIPSVTL